MSRLIDADKLKQHYAWWENGTAEMTLDEAKRNFDAIIGVQPTVDAVEVVRCKDCEYWVETDVPIFHLCARGMTITTLNADDYCSRGKKKEDAKTNTVINTGDAMSTRTNQSGMNYYPCGNCPKNGNVILASYPPQIRCEVTGKLHFTNETCDADLVAVVRCKDCKWKELCEKVSEYKGANGYCSKGERKEDAETD